MSLELEGISSDLLFLWHVMVSNKHLQTYHWNSPLGWENHPYFAIFHRFFLVIDVIDFQHFSAFQVRSW
jgi:hypothetical protein